MEVELTPFETMLIIGIQRLYDVQMATLSVMNYDLAKKLESAHEQGRTLSPPFAWSPEDDLETE